MYGEFNYNQPSLSTLYVMIDWDDTASLNPYMFKELFLMLGSNGFIPKICTARGEHFDNEDIFEHFSPNEVIFCNGQQKKDILHLHDIKRSEVAFWIDDSPEAIVDKEDLGNLMWYFNN
ncbi:hypothetical protein NVP1170O_176 [Vibrio phage 1.170.O._10N.261.52.C3]|nr:hypothetical protein NVP1170O_176 [Vibrio phage 1.170.O._10N.261.52.C3]